MKKNWLNGKTVIISGASGGIGFNLAKELILKHDCKIIGIARNEQKIKDAIFTLNEKQSNFTYRLFDVSKKENWQDFALDLEKDGIAPDILINNAGFMLPFAKFEHYTEQEIDEIISTDFISVVYAVKYLLPLIKKSTTPAIINVSSVAGMCAVVGESMYCASKFAVRGFTQTLIQEYKKQIYIAGVYPGFIRTNILNRMSVNDKENKLIQKIMMPVEKATKKILRGLKRKKKTMVMGIDGRSMSFFGRLFPSLTPSLVTKVLKISGLDLFDEVFEDNKQKKEQKK